MEIQRSSIKDQQLKKATLRDNSSFDSTVENLRYVSKRSLVNKLTTNVNQLSYDNTTVTEAQHPISESQHPSTYKASNSNYISTKLDVRRDNIFLGNCKYPVSDNEIHLSRIKRSTAEKESTLKSKSSLGSTVRKTSLRVLETVVNQSSTDVSQDSFCYETVTGAQHPSTYESSYKDNISGKPHVRCDNMFYATVNIQYPTKKFTVQV
ncbi:unnamed protein product [Mytilus coruscus]|uniref:Uncharacterized protein n=1 Tax=Mytilus coruscus TaxID=42192 RepID=A0A6J8BER3_MYTCO|nr:unnamed protein product [Mytilus coruscus]